MREVVHLQSDELREHAAEAAEERTVGAHAFTSDARTLAVLRGGQATTIATINCFSLITSGLWGLLWYRELKGRPAVAWAVAAAFTAAMSVLLSMEKG